MTNTGLDIPMAGQGRRAALAALLGGVMIAATARTADAQTTVSPDTAPLQFALNLQYLTTNILQAGTYGPGRQLPSQYIAGGESPQVPGVFANFSFLSRAVSFTGRRGIGARCSEMADEHWSRTLVIRGVLRADSIPQTVIDYSPARFTAMLQAAGAIGAGSTFNPYTSATNFLIALEPLFSVQASAFAAILPLMTNDATRALMCSMAAAAANHATMVRAMLADLAAADATILPIVDKLAAWRERIDGTSVTDRGLSAITAADGRATTRLAVTDADGLFLGRTPQQALNVLFMTSAEATSGGFFPNGINGSIVRSAAN